MDILYVNPFSPVYISLSKRLTVSFRSGEARITLFASESNAATYDFYVRFLFILYLYGQVPDGTIRSRVTLPIYHLHLVCKAY